MVSKIFEIFTKGTSIVTNWCQINKLTNKKLKLVVVAGVCKEHLGLLILDILHTIL